jgi:N-acetylmuramoyl-L-alanine amidase
LNTAHGEFTFQPGSLTAYWEGLEVRLGFAPQVAGGELFLHALDVRKTIETLARGHSASASPNRIIVIDPGHGGKQPGTRSIVDGRVEKEFTLDWALRLGPLLEQRGWRVLLTRTNDTDVSLVDRVAFANEHNADFFLSLHFNSSGNGSREPAGLETYLLTPTGMPSSLTREYRDDTSENLPGNALDAENLIYAVRLHRALLQVNGNKDRGVRHARYQFVLRGQRCPAVLVEGGYLSNPSEAQLIALPVYRQRLAEAVAKGLE